jgi:hypothetical protein
MIAILLSDAYAHRDNHLKAVAAKLVIVKAQFSSSL